MSALETPVEEWERYHIAHESAAVEVYVPPKGQLPPAPSKKQHSPMLSPFLVNLGWGATRDYAPKLWLVAFFSKRTRPAQPVTTAEVFEDENFEIMKQYYADLGIHDAPAAKSSWRALQISGRTWFALQGVPEAFTYATPASRDFYLVLRGTSGDAKELSEKRQLVEDIAARVRFLSQ